MSNTSNPDSIKPISPIDATITRVLVSVDRAARAVGCEYFLAGAMARDLILVHVYGLSPGRATRDIDFGIALENWDQFESFKQELLKDRQFSQAEKLKQRMLFADQWEVPIDIIPFGAIESPDGTITWPPHRDVALDVAGFREALDSAVTLAISDELIVRVASLPGLTILKLLAWQDRRKETNKDADDLHKIITKYADAGNLDRIYEHEMQLLETAEFDLELAGAELLGRDTARLCRETTLRRIRDLLESEALSEELLLQMNRANNRFGEESDHIEILIDRFRRGLLGT